MHKQRLLPAKIIWTVGLLLSILLLWIVTTFNSVVQLNNALRTMEVAAVARHSRYLHLTSSAISWLTFRSSPTIESLDAGLGIAAQAEKAAQALTTIQTSASTESVDLSELFLLVASLETDSIRLEKNLPNCAICSSYIPSTIQSDVLTLLPYIQTASEISTHLLTGTHRYLIVFQNSDELRATGGFMGSYTILTIIDGLIQPMTVEDIYDADGQFTGKIPAPSGVAEYLSSDNGLRLPDANWAPHFPTSAKQILQFFAFGERDDFQGVVAITDNYFAELLDLIGPVWLPDYQVSVTPENLTTVLRTNREEFFAGSIQKKHLLGQFQNQVLIALSQENISPFELAQITLKHMRQKNILAYSSSDSLQEIVTSLDIDGGLFIHDANASVAFVESNVGINKANRGISRALSLSTSGTTLTAQYKINNANVPPSTTQLQQLVATQDRVPSVKNQADHLSYVNYQRVIYPSDWNIQDISVPGVERVKIDTMNQAFSPGLEVTQAGFLVVVPEQSEVLVTITFDTKYPLSGTDLELYKQPGTTPLPVWLQTNQGAPFATEPTLILEKNNVTIMP